MKNTTKACIDDLRQLGAMLASDGEKRPDALYYILQGLSEGLMAQGYTAALDPILAQIKERVRHHPSYADIREGGLPL